MICTIIYLENPDKARFADLKKRAKNDYILYKAEYPRTVTAVNSLILNYHPTYKSNMQTQSQSVSNQLMFSQHGKTGDDEGETKENKQNHRRNLYHITCNYCGEKGHYAGKRIFPTYKELKQDK